MIMSTTRYSTAFAHLVSAGASIWAFRAAGISNFSLGSFGIFLLNSAIGIVTFVIKEHLFGVQVVPEIFLEMSQIWHQFCLVFASGNPEFGSKLKGIYGHTLFLSKCIGLPFITTQMCLNYGIQKEIAYLHLGFTTLPIIAHLIEDRSKKNLLDAVIFSNLMSVAYFSYVKANYYGIAMLVSYSVNHFMFGTDGTAFDTSIPSLDLFMYGLSFFNFFAIKTLSD